MVELKDTINLMQSQNYKDRFVAEYLQLKTRAQKLQRFCVEIKAKKWVGEEEPKHDCPLELLEAQLRAMHEYLHTLELRAVIEKIDLLNHPI